MHESGLARALARLLLACGVIQILLVSSALAQSLDGLPMIFDVRRSLPLEPDEPVFHDFYIDSGPEAGFKKGMFVTVVRGIPVHDPFQNKQQGVLRVPVAKLRVIHVDKNLTVARLYSQMEDEYRPILEFEAVMIGDRVDSTSMTMDEPEKPKSKKKSLKAANSVRDAAADAPPEATNKGTQPAPASEAPPVPVTEPPQPVQQAAPPSVQQTVQNSQGEAPVAKSAFPESTGADIVRAPVPEPQQQSL